MGTFWQYSFVMDYVPSDLISEVKEALKEIFSIDADTYYHEKTSSYSINIYDNQIYGNNSFFRYAEDELKNRIWKYGYLKFKFAIEVVATTEPISFTENDYKKFKKSLP